MLGMTQTDPGGFHHTLLGEGVGSAVKDQEWLTAFFLMHVDIAPAHRFSNAGAKCFGHCFLGRESGRKMARWKFHRLAISDFAIGKNPFHETFAEPIERVLNALDLDHVHANAEHAHGEFSGATRPTTIHHLNVSSQSGPAIAGPHSKSLRLFGSAFQFAKRLGLRQLSGAFERAEERVPLRWRHANRNELG